MSSTIKVGVIGAGAIATDHVASVNSYPDAEVVAIADRDAPRANAVAGKFTIPRVYATAQRLLKDTDIDAVTISLPNKFHAPYAIAALKAGKHVCLDKPFAMNAREARTVIAAAHENRRVFTLGMNFRYKPETQTLRAIIKHGDLGDVYHAKTTVLQRSGCPKFGTWFGNRALAGGGALVDTGVHFLDLCLFLIDNFQPAAVSGATYSKFGPRGLGEGGWGHSKPGKHVFTVDDFATALIKMKNGATVTLDTSWALHLQQPLRSGVELFGTEAGAAVFPLRLSRFGKKKGDYEIIEPRVTKLRYPHANRFHNWLDAILKRDELCVKPAQALVVQEILDAIAKSAKTGREVRL